MAVTFRIENRAGTLAYDFLADTYRIRMDTWQTQVLGSALVMESFVLVGRDTDANLQGDMQTLQNLCEALDQYWTNQLESTSYFLAINNALEGDADGFYKRALIRSITIAPLAVGPFTALLGSHKGVFFSVSIIRLGAWETFHVSEIFSATGTTSLIGGTLAIGATGTSATSRFPTFSIAGSVGSISKMWLGIRPIYAGKASFDPLWQLESAATQNGATIVGGDTSWSGGSYVLYTLTAASLPFSYISVDVVSGTWAHFMGRYKVLLRCKLSAANDCAVQMGYGYNNPTGAPAFTPIGTAYITANHTALNFIDLGEVQFPPFPAGRFGSPATLMKDITIQLFGYYIDGAADIYADCLVLIPLEHYVSFDGAAITVGPGGGTVTLYTLDDGSLVAFGDDTSGTPLSGLSANYRNWNYPVSGGTLVFCGQGTTSSDVADAITYTYSTVARHRLLKPST